MQNIQSSWGIKQLTPTRIHVDHTQLQKIKVDIQDYLPSTYFWQENKDGSATLVANSTTLAKQLVEEIAMFFKNFEEHKIDVPNQNYSIPKNLKPILDNLSMAFEGCVAMILMDDLKETKFAPKNWEFLDSPNGGLFIDPFTLIFYKDHLKVTGPINTNNYYIRARIERTATQAVQKIIERINESQPNYEGLAMISYVEDKTPKKAKDIANIIYEKSKEVQIPERFSLLYT